MKPGIHDGKRKDVERLLGEGKPVTQIAKMVDIPLGSMPYLLAKWQLLDKQVRASRHFTESGSQSISAKLKLRHAETDFMKGENHWKHGLLKLHGDFVPEADVKEVLSELVEQDMILAQMATECGVDPKTITNWLRKFGMQQGIRSGKRCSWYKGGWRKERGPDWLKVRKEVLERDEYKCVRCGMTQDEARATGHTLSVHHIVPWRETHDNSLPNLIALCQSCHMKEEWTNGCWSNNTQEGEQ